MWNHYGFCLCFYLRKVVLLCLKNPKEIEFICLKCKTKERIPRDVVEFLDSADQIGVDTSVPPRFDCEKCDGLMVPIYYISVNGKVFEYKED